MSFAFKLEIYHFQEGEIKQIENESKNLSEILHGQKCELRKLEEQLYEYNESVSRLISSKEETKSHLIRLKDTYAKESAAYITQEKLSKMIQIIPSFSLISI